MRKHGNISVSDGLAGPRSDVCCPSTQLRYSRLPAGGVVVCKGVRALRRTRSGRQGGRLAPPPFPCSRDAPANATGKISPQQWRTSPLHTKTTPREAHPCCLANGPRCQGCLTGSAPSGSGCSCKVDTGLTSQRVNTRKSTPVPRSRFMGRAALRAAGLPSRGQLQGRGHRCPPRVRPTQREWARLGPRPGWAPVPPLTPCLRAGGP